MRLALMEAGSRRFVAVEHEGSPVDVTGLVAGVDAALEEPEPLVTLAMQYDLLAHLAARLDEPAAGRPVELGAGVRYLPPVRRPGKMVCLGRNYAAHAAESGLYLPAEPLFFCKASSAVIGHGDAIRIPSWAGRVDPEAEMALIIGRPGRYIKPEEAFDHVLGYTCCNDVSAREMQAADVERGDPWFRSKSIDTFAPLGPYLVTPDELPDPHRLTIRCIVSGEVRQDSNTSYLVHKIPAIVAAVSRFMTLETGDVIATGTPAGMAPIKPGDTVEVHVEGVCRLANPVVSE
ncbi:MAG: fumarylacetoacetate hydrolase family protein [Firmicutes bacterium]|nr:fumarylacetoacetate hydrolase family protein [Bacillota bacterium]